MSRRGRPRAGGPGGAPLALSGPRERHAGRGGRRPAGRRISHAIETHLHNDYVSGGRELAALTGATHIIGAGAELAHERRPLRDGEAFEVGTIRFRVLDTPGHTPEH